MNPITIIDYRPEHQPYFEAFNTAWLSPYGLEPFDTFVLQQPEKAILEPGGAILVALYDGEVAGVLGLRKMNAHTYEYTKMAVAESFRRRGIGEALSYASFEKAKELGADTIILYSNKQQAAAVKLYEKLGFVHLEPDTEVYERADVKMRLYLKDVLKTA